jgi:hypothetical protein
MTNQSNNILGQINLNKSSEVHDIYLIFILRQKDA